MNNRRRFLKTGSLAFIGGIILSQNIKIFGQTASNNKNFPIPPAALADTYLTAEHFKPLVDTEFSIKLKNGKTIPLKLVEVSEPDASKNTLSSIPVQSFILIFEAPNGISLKDDIYNVSTSTMNNVPLSVSAVGKSRKRYQVVFSRIFN